MIKAIRHQFATSLVMTVFLTPAPAFNAKGLGTERYPALGQTTLDVGHIWRLTETFRPTAERNLFFVRQAWEQYAHP